MNPVDELGDALFAAATCFVVVYGAYMLARGLTRREETERAQAYLKARQSAVEPEGVGCP